MEKLLKNTMKVFLLCIIVLLLFINIANKYIYIPKIIYIPIIIVIIGNLLYFFDCRKIYDNFRNEKLLIILPVFSVLLVKVAAIDLSNIKDVVLNLLFILIGGIINFIIKKSLYDKWIREI